MWGYPQWQQVLRSKASGFAEVVKITGISELACVAQQKGMEGESKGETQIIRCAYSHVIVKDSVYCV